jgi:hypothetical protein
MSLRITPWRDEAIPEIATGYALAMTRKQASPAMTPLLSLQETQ